MLSLGVRFRLRQIVLTAERAILQDESLQGWRETNKR